MGQFKLLHQSRVKGVSLSSADQGTMSSYLIICLVLVHLGTATAQEVKCSTKATSEGKANTPCVFPFKHGPKTFTSCTTAGGYSEPWCSTKTDSSGKHVKGNWGTCDMRKCDTCSTTSGAACMIPFTFGSKKYLACTKDGGDGKAWCSTKVDGNGKHIAGNFGDCDMTKCSSE